MSKKRKAKQRREAAQRRRARGHAVADVVSSWTGQPQAPAFWINEPPAPPPRVGGVAQAPDGDVRWVGGADYQHTGFLRALVEEVADRGLALFYPPGFAEVMAGGDQEYGSVAGTLTRASEAAKRAARTALDGAGPRTRDDVLEAACAAWWAVEQPGSSWEVTNKTPDVFEQVLLDSDVAEEVIAVFRCDAGHESHQSYYRAPREIERAKTCYPSPDHCNQPSRLIRVERRRCSALEARNEVRVRVRRLLVAGMVDGGALLRDPNGCPGDLAALAAGLRFWRAMAPKPPRRRLDYDSLLTASGERLDECGVVLYGTARLPGEDDATYRQRLVALWPTAEPVRRGGYSASGTFEMSHEEFERIQSLFAPDVAAPLTVGVNPVDPQGITIARYHPGVAGTIERIDVDGALSVRLDGGERRVVQPDPLAPSPGMVLQSRRREYASLINCYVEAIDERTVRVAVQNASSLGRIASVADDGTATIRTVGTPSTPSTTVTMLLCTCAPYRRSSTCATCGELVTA